MKKFLFITGVFFVFILTACKHSAKEEEVHVQDMQSSTDHRDTVIKQIYTDDYGDQLEVAVNENKNTVSIRLDGKSYELKKKDELPEYTASNSDYQFSDIRGEVTFMRKGYNIVLFHHKREKTAGNTKMASF